MGNSLFVNVNKDYVDYFEHEISSEKETDNLIKQLYNNSNNDSGFDVDSLGMKSENLDLFVNGTDNLIKQLYNNSSNASGLFDVDSLGMKSENLDSITNCI